MLQLLRRRRSGRRTTQPTVETTSLLDHPDLKIRNLLDDPRLRRAMGLDAEVQPERVESDRLVVETAA